MSDFRNQQIANDAGDHINMAIGYVF